MSKELDKAIEEIAKDVASQYPSTDYVEPVVIQSAQKHIAPVVEQLEHETARLQEAIKRRDGGKIAELEKQLSKAREALGHIVLNCEGWKDRDQTGIASRVVYGIYTEAKATLAATESGQDHETAKDVSK